MTRSNERRCRSSTMRHCLAGEKCRDRVHGAATNPEWRRQTQNSHDKPRMVATTNDRPRKKARAVETSHPGSHGALNFCIRYEWAMQHSTNGHRAWPGSNATHWPKGPALPPSKFTTLLLIPRAETAANPRESCGQFLIAGRR
jgi:hypothetical protein